MKIGRLPVEKRFWMQTDKMPGFGPNGDCWRWLGFLGPYGRMLVNGRRTKAARVSYELHFGPIPPGEGYHGTCVCHRCDNPACVNPEHLFLGSQQANVDDRDAKGRQSRGLEHQRPRQGQKHPHAKLTDEKVRAIIGDPRLYREIASDFAITESHVCNLKAGRGWQHLQLMENAK